MINKCTRKSAFQAEGHSYVKCKVRLWSLPAILTSFGIALSGGICHEISLKILIRTGLGSGSLMILESHQFPRQRNNGHISRSSQYRINLRIDS